MIMNDLEDLAFFCSLKKTEMYAIPGLTVMAFTEWNILNSKYSLHLGIIVLDH